MKRLLLLSLLSMILVGGSIKADFVTVCNDSEDQSSVIYFDFYRDSGTTATRFMPNPHSHDPGMARGGQCSMIERPSWKPGWSKRNLYFSTNPHDLEGDLGSAQAAKASEPFRLRTKGQFLTVGDNPDTVHLRVNPNGGIDSRFEQLGRMSK